MFKVIYYSNDYNGKKQKIVTSKISCSVASVVSESWQPNGKYSLPGSSVLGLLQAEILEWVGISSSRESSRPRDQTHISCISRIGNELFTTEPPGKPY